MEIVDQTEKRNPIVDLVNPLIEDAFGKGFKGNYDHAHMDIMSGPSGFKEVNGLRLVGKVMGRRLFGLRCEYVGQLGDRYGPEFDGSVIAVFPEYEHEAKRYAELYQRKTGKDVRIILTDVINAADGRKILSR